MTGFRVIDVKADHIMAAALLAAERDHASRSPVGQSDVSRVLGLGEQQSNNVLAMCAQLRLLRGEGTTGYRFAGDSSLRRSPKSGLPSFFRAALQHYPPFLIFVSYLSRGFSEEEAARYTTAAFSIGLQSDRVARVFRAWGTYSGVIQPDGALDLETKEVLDLGFLSSLASALRDDLTTQTFVINEVGQAVAADLFSRGIDFGAVGRALGKHHNSPKDAIREAGHAVEEYLAQLSIARGGPGSDIGKLADFLGGANQRAVLRVHRNVAVGVAGLRNAADHGSDPDTGMPWMLTSEAALVGSLLAMLLLKSVVRYLNDGTQEI